jgi:hypothetical protein
MPRQRRFFIQRGFRAAFARGHPLDRQRAHNHGHKKYCQQYSG